MLCQRAQVRLKDDDEGLDAIEDEVNYDAWKQPARARPNGGQHEAQ